MKYEIREVLLAEVDTEGLSAADFKAVREIEGVRVVHFDPSSTRILLTVPNRETFVAALSAIEQKEAASVAAKPQRSEPSAQDSTNVEVFDKSSGKVGRVKRIRSVYDPERNRHIEVYDVVFDDGTFAHGKDPKDFERV